FKGKTVLEYFLTSPCKYGQKDLQEVMKSLLMDGANLQQRSTLRGRTALELAIKQCSNYRSYCYNQEEISIIVTMLLENGADANETISSYPGDKEVSPIAFAIEEDQVGAVRALLLNAVDPNQETNDGSPLLLKAVKKGNIEIVDALLSHKAQADATDKKGEI
ncbi:unnamed protein product, partial [Meganyctiphanes norvegica]